MKIRRALCLLLCAAVALCSGCSAVVDLLSEPDAALWVAYSSPEDQNTLVFQYVSDLEDYHSVYREYGSDVYYSTLDETGQQIYRLLEYALDHCATRILFDERMADDLTELVSHVLTCLSLDSPLVEQNLLHRYYSVTETQTVPVGFLERERTVRGILLRVVGFAPDSLALKEQAVAKAQTIVDALPQGMTASEKSWALYRYLRENVEYHTYDNPWVANYLYDALCKGVSHCDGFANAYSLLCNMAGIPCFEKLYLSADEHESGHTWNCFQLDGVWYNADAAVDSSDVDAIETKIGHSFWHGFSDGFQNNPVYLADRLPVCDRDLLELTFAATASDDLAGKIVSAFRGGAPYVYFTLDGPPADPDVWQRVSNALRANITWIILNDGIPYRYVVCRD